MTNPTPENFDWTQAEAEMADAEVVDLDAARARRAGETDPNSIETDDMDDAEDGPVLVDSIAAQRRPRFSLAAFRDAERVPIIPSWLKSRGEFGKNVA